MKRRYVDYRYTCVLYIGAEPWRGLVSVGTQEPIKLEIAHLLQHLCDCQLRRKVERIVAFARRFVKSVQEVRLRGVPHRHLPHLT